MNHRRHTAPTGASLTGSGPCCRGTRRAPCATPDGSGARRAPRRFVGLAIALLLTALSAVWATDLALGATAPDFTLTDLTGKSHHLAAYKGKAKAVVLVWMSSVCPGGRAYEQRVESVYKEFQGKGVVFLTINSQKDETPDSIRKHQRASKLTFAVLKDPHNQVADLYGAVAVPEAFVFDGGLKLRYHGAIDNSKQVSKVDPEKRYLRNAVAAVLAGQTPSPSETRPAGCAIDRE